MCIAKAGNNEDRSPKAIAAQEGLCTEVKHVFPSDLFMPYVEPPPNFIDDMTMDEPPQGLGLPGERFDLTCADCEKTFLRLKKSVHGYFYGCPSWPACSGTHGAHPDGRPKGTPGNKATRIARIAAHEALDPLFKGHTATMREGEAYAWMAKAMGLTHEQAHIAHFSVEQCNKLILLVNEKLGPSAWEHLTSKDPFEEELVQVVAEREDPPLPTPRTTISDHQETDEYAEDDGADVMTTHEFVRRVVPGWLSQRR